MRTQGLRESRVAAHGPAIAIASVERRVLMGAFYVIGSGAFCAVGGGRSRALQGSGAAMAFMFRVTAAE